MGINLMVCTDTPDDFLEVFHDCHRGTDKNFYTFLISAWTYDEESIVISVGHHFGVDLEPLTVMWSPEGEAWEEARQRGLIGDRESSDAILKDYYHRTPPDGYWHDIDKLISTIETLHTGIASDPTIIQRLDYHPDNRKWLGELYEAYFLHGGILEDLQNLLEELQCYKKHGARRVYFTAG